MQSGEKKSNSSQCKIGVLLRFVLFCFIRVYSVLCKSRIHPPLHMACWILLPTFLPPSLAPAHQRTSAAVVSLFLFLFSFLLHSWKRNSLTLARALCGPPREHLPYSAVQFIHCRESRVRC